MENLKKNEQDKNDVLMALFYIGKLVEGGFIAGGPKVTMAGFDLAMDLKESGYVLDKDRVEKICDAFGFEPIDGFVTLIMEVQAVGLPAMLEAANKLNDEANLN